MIRLIAADLDDTLLDARGNVSPRTLSALRAAMAAGCGISLSSGRMPEAALPFAEEIGVNAPLLLYNGALIYDHRTDEPVHAERIPFAVALEIVRLLEAEGFYVQLYPGKGYYCSEVTAYTKAYAASIRVPATPAHMPMAAWLQERRCDMQKLLVIDTAEGADRAQALLRGAFGGAVSSLKSKPHYLEIAPVGVDKGRALKRLGEILGVGREETAAFGDGQNDVPMLEYAGEGWAMRNACPEALRCTDRIAPRNTQDGVARVIEKYLEEGKLGG